MTEFRTQPLSSVSPTAKSRHVKPDTEGLPKIVEKRADQQNDEQLQTIMTVIQSLAGSMGKDGKDIENLLNKTVSQNRPFDG